MPPAIEVHHLSKRFASPLERHVVQALRGINVTVAQGEIFGLLGPNGAGKTTLVKILLSIVRPTEGEASLFGVPIHRPEARRRVGYLPENHRFPGFLTAEQMLDLYGQMANVPADERRERIPHLLDQVRLRRWTTANIRTFSKGMMQRLGLAQALLNEPDLLFLDEPTDGVDPLGRREIRDLLLLLRDEGKTIFLNSHLLSEVEQVCTRVAILHEGRRVREGTIAELTAVDRIYDVRCTPVPPATLQTLGNAVRPLEQRQASEDGLQRYHIRADDRRDLNALLDQLRSAGVLLDAVHPVRRSLEDYFIDVVQPIGDDASPA